MIRRIDPFCRFQEIDIYIYRCSPIRTNLTDLKCAAKSQERLTSLLTSV